MNPQYRPSGWLRVTSAVLCFVLLAQPVLADTVILRTGEQVRGTIANREQYRIPMPRLAAVSILTADASGENRELRRFEPDSVEAVVIEVDGRTTVYDLHRGVTPPAPPRQPVTTITRSGISEFPSTTGDTRGSVGGAVAAVVGIAAFTVGVAVKFGGPRVELTNGGFSAEEHTYNAANYSLMGLGLALGVVGLVVSTMPPASDEAPASLRAATPEHRVALQVHF